MRRKFLFVGVAMFLLSWNICLVSSQDCISNLRIDLSAYEINSDGEGNQIYKKSHYQPTGVDGFMREGDFLFIESLYAERNSSCLDEEDSLTIQFKEPDIEEWTQNLVVPIKFVNSSKYSLNLDNAQAEYGKRYVDSYGNLLGIHSELLDKEGVWGIRMIYHDEQVHENYIAGKISQTDGFKMANNNLLIPQRIEVLNRIDVTQLETLRQIKDESKGNTYVVLFVGLVTILVGLASIVLMYKTSKKQILKMDEQYEKQTKKEDEREEGKQLDILRTLLTELTFLESNLNSYKDTFSKKGHYPFYELWDIDVALYLRTLNHSIKEKETIGLKENLMILKDKLLIINNMKLESKKDEEERGGEKVIQAKIEIIRKGIIKIIDDDLLPIIKKSKKVIEKNFKINS